MLSSCFVFQQGMQILLLVAYKLCIFQRAKSLMIVIKDQFAKKKY